MTATRINTPQLAFPYPGSKSRMMAKLLPLMPTHNHYVDVFGGSGASILGKPQMGDLETFNDIDGDVTNFFNVLATEDFYELSSRASRTNIHVEGLVNTVKEMSGREDLSPLDQAWVWLVLTHGTQNITHPKYRDMPFKFYRKAHNDLLKWDNIAFRLACIKDRFKHVQVLKREWKDVITYFSTNKNQDENHFFYIDPPYVRATRNSYHYLHEFTDEKHEELLEILESLNENVMISGYASDLYDTKLKHWNRDTFDTTNCHGEPRTEVVWMNY